MLKIDTHTIALMLLLLLVFCVPSHPLAGSEALPQNSTGDKQKSTFVPLKELRVTTTKELAEALKQVAPGTAITIAPGTYTRGIFLKDVQGRQEAPIVITGEDAANPPVFEGGSEGVKLSSCAYIRLGNLTFNGFTQNGMNIDDGGNKDKPSRHLILENLNILDTGPKGNNDALKISGTEHFVVRNCRIEGWGGSGIDMVGCRYGLVEGCTFTGKEGFRTKNAIQIKGGSRSILVQTSLFRNAGERTVNIGGSTGLQYFREPIRGYEAREVIFAGNTVLGGEAAIAWVTSQESAVHHNLFYLPEKWVGRILQESKDQQFAPSQRGFFAHNVVVTDERVKVFFNIGKETLPETFVFYGNAWYRAGSAKKPNLPTSEKNGIYGIDPEIKESQDGRLVCASSSPKILEIGPWAYTPWTLDHEFDDVLLPPVMIPKASLDLTKTLLFAAAVLGVGGVAAILQKSLKRKRRRKARHRRDTGTSKEPRNP